MRVDNSSRWYTDGQRGKPYDVVRKIPPAVSDAAAKMVGKREEARARAQRALSLRLAAVLVHHVFERAPERRQRVGPSFVPHPVAARHPPRGVAVTHRVFARRGRRLLRRPPVDRAVAAALLQRRRLLALRQDRAHAIERLFDRRGRGEAGAAASEEAGRGREFAWVGGGRDAGAAGQEVGSTAGARAYSPGARGGSASCSSASGSPAAASRRRQCPSGR